MNNQTFRQIEQILINDKKHSHFLERIKKDFSSYQKRPPTDFEFFFVREKAKFIGFSIIASSPLKIKEWEKVFKEEGWAGDDFRIDPLALELVYMYVRPEFRRKGKGSELLNKALLLAKSKGASALYTYVSEKTGERALEFYKKRGAITIRDFSSEDEGINTAYLMWKL